MSKSFVVVIIVLTLLASPGMTNAGFFGSSFDGCKDPGDDIAGYILEKSGDSTLTRSNVEQALKFVPTDVENVTYGDIFGWLRVTENTAECFAQNDYEKGLKIIGTHAGRFTASKALGVAVAQLVGGAGGAVVFLPATIFQWGVDYLINKMEIGAVNHQLVLYIAAIESCEESYGSRVECQQMIIDESKYNNFPTAFCSPNGFILEAATPKNPKFTNVAAVNSINPSTELHLTGQIKITAQEFYRGAAVIYDAIAAKYSGSLNAARNAALQGVVMEAKKVSGENSNTKTQNNQSVGFFFGLWQSVTNPIKIAYTSVKDFFTGATSQKDKAEIQPSDLSRQISKPLPINDNKENLTPVQPSNPPNQQEQLRQAEEAKKKQAEEEKKRLKAERQKQEDQRKIEEQRHAQAVAEENLKKTKTADEQGIAEEAIKKAEQARIAVEQEAQKHQQEEALRRAQEEQRLAEEQRKAQAAAEEAKRREQQTPQPIIPSPAPTAPSTQIPTPTPVFQQPAQSAPSTNLCHRIIGRIIDQDGNPITGYARFNLKDLSKRSLLSPLSSNKDEADWDTTSPYTLGSKNVGLATCNALAVPDGKYVLTIDVWLAWEWNAPISLEINVSGADVDLGNIIVRKGSSTIKATVVDQKGAVFENVTFTCKKLDDGSNCPTPAYSGTGLMALGPYRPGKYRVTIQGGTSNRAESDVVVKDVQITNEDGKVVDLGNIVLKRWGRIQISLVDSMGNPFLASLSLMGVFDNDLCDISPMSGIFGMNMPYYCSQGGMFNYSKSFSVTLSSLTYQLPDGQYVLRALGFQNGEVKEVYKTTVIILQGQDVDLGTIKVGL